MMPDRTPEVEAQTYALMAAAAKKWESEGAQAMVDALDELDVAKYDSVYRGR
jgi:hypothetical protein